MIQKEKPDIVDICTPPSTHARLAISAIENGSHVLIEKPLALELPDCDAILDAASRHQRKICVMHNQVFNPAFIKAKKLFLKGAIGDFLGLRIFLSTPVDYMTSKSGHWAHKLPGGVLGETGPHVVYLALAFLKNIQDAEVHARRNLSGYPWSNLDDFRINLIAENGTGSAVLIYGSNQWAADMDIIGTKASLEIDLQTQSVVKKNRYRLSAFSVGVSELSAILQTLGAITLNGLKFVLGRKADAHAVGINSFVESILEGKPSPVSAIDSKEVVRVMQMIAEKIKCIS